MTAVGLPYTAPTSTVTTLSVSLLSIHTLRLFLCVIVVLCLWNVRKLFLQSRGWSHRLAGACNLLCIVYGSWAVVRPPYAPGHDVDYQHNLTWSYRCLLYDTLLGLLGTIATLTASRDFPHRTVTNSPGQSGTLSQHAMVTQGEMLEHAFYQGLNLVQAWYLHGITWWWGLPPLHPYSSTTLGVVCRPIAWRLVAILAATSPWLVRRCFPVHSFSTNWTKNEQKTKGGGDPSGGRPFSKGKVDRDKSKLTGTSITAMKATAMEWVENRMYQIKKWQYVFYKHFILHGINISVAFPFSNRSVGGTTTATSYVDFLSGQQQSSTSLPLPLTPSWRIFWLALNASYVMEFFLQSLVKRDFIAQNTMLRLQRLLMTAATTSATMAVWGTVRVEMAVVSVILNFTNRGADVVNVMLVATFAALSSSSGAVAE